MSVETSALPTDSLYKMLTIGGLVLVIGGIAIGWKAIGETQDSRIALGEAEAALAQANVPLRHRYNSIINAHQSIERRLDQAIAGVNVSALHELKGGQPNSFPKLGETMSAPKSKGVEWGAIEVPFISNDAGVKEWFEIADRIRKHREAVDGLLKAPNLTIISPELVADSTKKFDAILQMVQELQESAILLASSQQALNRAKLRSDLARERQDALLWVSLLLFLVGAFVFTRASINWYNDVQRYEDAKIRQETKNFEISPQMKLFPEIIWLIVPVTIASTIWFCIRWLYP